VGLKRQHRGISKLKLQVQSSGDDSLCISTHRFATLGLQNWLDHLSMPQMNSIEVPQGNGCWRFNSI
jgi:hypothetical protein